MLEKIDLNKTVDKKSYRRVMDEASRKLGLLQPARGSRSTG